MNNFCVITPYFNPANYSSLWRNYLRFAEELDRQRVNLVTIELVFGNQQPQAITFSSLQKRQDGYQCYSTVSSQSIMWQKERLINLALRDLPAEIEYFAWIDCDVLWQVDDWAEQAVEALKTFDIVQLFKKVHHLPPGHTSYQGKQLSSYQGVVWQRTIHKNWLERRRLKLLPFSCPGFAWAARRSVFSDIGLYDKNIIGSGDTFLVDCYFDSWPIHGFAQKFTDHMKKDMMVWRTKFANKKVSVGYLPLDIAHLYHGDMKNRQYMDRHDILRRYDFNPATDIQSTPLRNGRESPFEWASDKPGMHEAIKQYFFDRKDDEL